MGSSHDTRLFMIAHWTFPKWKSLFTNLSIVDFAIHIWFVTLARCQLLTHSPVKFRFHFEIQVTWIWHQNILRLHINKSHISCCFINKYLCYYKLWNTSNFTINSLIQKTKKTIAISHSLIRLSHYTNNLFIFLLLFFFVKF